jgi:ankyrin repeat domain-containing protein 50
LLQQIAIQQSNISDDIRDLFNNHTTKLTRPFIECSTLRTACAPLSKIFVVVDALDECASQSTDKFLKELQHIGPKLHLMITSRPSIMGVTDYFKDAVQLEIRAHNEDIATYLTERLQEESRLKRYIEKDPSLSDDIINTILDKAEGMLVSQRPLFRHY